MAAHHRLAVLKPASLKSDDVQEALERAESDVVVVAAFGMILPVAMLSVPAGGCLNIHASLLPRWRGAAPIQRAILAGDARTGITIMRMDEGLDTGPSLLQRATQIAARETAGSLLETLSELGAASILEALARLDQLQPSVQDAALATYAPKVAKPEARIDWGLAAAQIDRQVRAFNPAPGAETRLDGAVLKIWDAEPVPGEGEPGTLLHADARNAIVVACGSGALRVRRLQRAGGKQLTASSFLQGTRLDAGQKLESAASPTRAEPAG